MNLISAAVTSEFQLTSALAMKNPAGLLHRMNEVFGGYRAEWLKDELFDLFSEPAFFPELQTRRACFLFGGRGTGKTTLLRALSYQGQRALKKSEPGEVPSLAFVGLYLRIDLNRTAAFQGPEIAERQWVRLFGHYVNLELCSSLLEYALWYSGQSGQEIAISSDELQDISESLNIDAASSLTHLQALIRRARIHLEASVNNIADGEQHLRLSLQGAPIDLLIDALRRTVALSTRDVFFLIDEYESLLEYQQKCFNTLVKYSGTNYSFKIGIKELGLQTAATLGEREVLSSPADYSRIDISSELEDVFDSFAEAVVSSRFQRVFGPEGLSIQPVTAFFPGLADEEEAVLLGVEERADEAYRAAQSLGVTKASLAWLRRETPYNRAFLRFLSDSQGTKLDALIEQARLESGFLESRRNNYGYAFLFTLRRGRAGIRKYYCGWLTFCKLAGCNIRYLLHLVDQSILLAAERLEDVAGPLTPETQTLAAQAVGKRILTDLEGVSREGARLTKLVLGLGRVFQVMAAQPEGHTPEVNQFFVRSDVLIGVEQQEALDELLRTAVMHLALSRLSGTKPTGDADTKDWEFMPHPVFSPYFCYSHRKKRKIGIQASDLLAIASHPAAAVARILREQRRDPAATELPDQMQLFEEAFEST